MAGSFKGHGYGRELLKTCEEDVAGTNGVVVMVGKKKLPYLSDKAFFIRHGYEVCDSCVPNIELLVKRFRPDAPFPRFKSCASAGLGDDVKGIHILHGTMSFYGALYQTTRSGYSIFKCSRAGTPDNDS